MKKKKKMKRYGTFTETRESLLTKKDLSSSESSSQAAAFICTLMQVQARMTSRK